MNPQEKRELVRTSAVRLKGIALILEAMLERDVPIHDTIIQQLRVDLTQISDNLMPLTQ